MYMRRFFFSRPSMHSGSRLLCAACNNGDTLTGRLGRLWDAFIPGWSAVTGDSPPMSASQTPPSLFKVQPNSPPTSRWPGSTLPAPNHSPCHPWPSYTPAAEVIPNEKQASCKTLDGSDTHGTWRRCPKRMLGSRIRTRLPTSEVWSRTEWLWMQRRRQVIVIYLGISRHSGRGKWFVRHEMGKSLQS